MKNLHQRIRNQPEGDHTKKFPFPIHTFIGINRTLTSSASNGDIGGQQHKADRKNQHQINQQKNTAAILCCQKRKSPEIAHSNCTPGRRKNKSELPCKTTFFLHLLFPISLLNLTYTNHNLKIVINKYKVIYFILYFFLSYNTRVKS